ncbi:hypothetical protein KVP70_16075 [Duganella sp. HSC-15S17]|nr:hypothetical protein [Duganella violaceicalia]
MLPVAPLAQWRSALRLARARPLPPSGPSTPHPRTALDLTILGMGQMRAAAEALQPGLWLRLRLRWDCALIAAHEHLAGTTPAPVSDAAVRHIIRAWRAAGVHRGAVATHTLPDIGTPHGTN